MASEIRVNSITNRSGLSTVTWNDEGLNVVGVATAHNFKTGTTNVHSTGVELANVNTGGATATFGGPLVGSTGSFSSNVTISGNLGVAGTVTYEDVARVDATGISTFREGFGVGPLAGIALTAYKDGSIRTTGVITATTYYGSGANLTGIDATQIVTGNTSVQTVDTGSDGHVKVSTEGTERLRIDSSGNVGVGVNNPSSFNSDGRNLVVGTGSGGQGISIYSANNNYGSIYFADGTSGSELYRGAVLYNHTSDFLRFDTASAERLRISSGGSLGVSHNLSGTANYNRLMLHNPHDGSCWMQMTSTASGSSANSDGLSIGLNSSNVAHIWQRENAKMMFATNGTSRMEISANGYVNQPYQPCFMAHSNGASHIDIPSSSGNDYVFTSEVFDNSSNYNTSNGRFTAPVAGKYVFGVQIYAGFSINGVRVQHARFKKNGGDEYGTDIFGGTSNAGGTSYHPTGVGTVMYELAVNDYVTWNVGTFAGSGSGSAQIYGSKSTRFWGYLVA